MNAPFAHNDNPRQHLVEGCLLDEDDGIPLADLRAAWARINAFSPSADILACAVAMRPGGAK